ncbi:MAG: ABC-2 type transport system permease protein [Pelagibacterales bacterium]|nr:ABC-2 type transport system permease protein [Pelagibacterales bacterium]
MRWHKIYGLILRHVYLIKSSFPRILDLIYWPSIQVFLWGFISKFFTLSSSYYSDAVGVILTAAILYDFLFRSSISYNMMFLEEIWSRNFTNLFIAPIKISEIITSLTITAILRTMIGLIPAALIAIPLFGVSIFKLGPPLFFLLLSLYIFGITLGLLVTSGLMRFGPSFENIAWASLFFLAPLGCIYYPIEILPEWLQIIAKILPLVHIFEEMRNILINDTFNTYAILKSIIISSIYFILGVIVFYISYYGARNRGTLINIGE